MIERTKDGGVVTLRLAHGKVNALDLELCQALRRELDAARDADAVILTASGTSFCAGVDLVRLTGGGAAYVERFFPVLRDFLVELFEFPRPVIAAANGHAIAGGCLMVAAADYRLMSGGRIGVPELLVGVAFPAIAIDILRHAAGRDARHLALSGATLEPQAAIEKGLLDEVVEAGALLARAHEHARRLASISRETFRINKLQLRRGGDHDDEALAVWRDETTHATIREYLARTVHQKRETAG